jgi:hypothetical protein
MGIDEANPSNECRGYENEFDLLPEHCHYRDEGCDLAASCLNCPYARCVYEQPGGRQRWLKKKRDGEIVRLFTRDGKGLKELARLFRVSTRTVQRALRNATAKGEEEK